MDRYFLLFLVIGLVSANSLLGNDQQKWGHIKIRDHAHMFYWLYYTTAGVENYRDRPLVIWLQGGPGASSTAFGNFAEIGPLDIELNPRNSTWVKNVNVLFVDNPVGTGFSYVEKTKSLTKNNREIAEDFLIFLNDFYEQNPEFKSTPLYIFSESYGGKMTVEIALVLSQAITNGKIECNFKGIGLGDAWISPVDTVMSWAPYLLQLGAIDQNGYDVIEDMANKTKKAFENGKYQEATSLWGQTEGAITEVTSGIDFYNVLAKVRPLPKDVDVRGLLFKPEGTFEPINENKLESLMKNNVSVALNVTNEWGAQNGEVFLFLWQDFMKPATSIVEELLNTTDIRIAIFNGQLDLIVDTPGTVNWVDKLQWVGSKQWKESEREVFSINGINEGYVRKQDNLAFYWVNRAGHMVPSDNTAAMDYILRDITNDFKSNLL
ncbi:unnamed protein product [Brassicogethes aeneus]|uniref:Carboxypeptidase n=1 Tax=Brassicogethes aeneus TaxID=1431903 RepID=A0A9P0FLK9_BRAAE|nr:unnamed protein product [Brassicogethes aeneus]